MRNIPELAPGTYGSVDLALRLAELKDYMDLATDPHYADLRSNTDVTAAAALGRERVVNVNISHNSTHILNRLGYISYTGWPRKFAAEFAARVPRQDRFDALIGLNARILDAYVVVHLLRPNGYVITNELESAQALYGLIEPVHTPGDLEEIDGGSLYSGGPALLYRSNQ